jgi:hypothetical protein
MPLPNIFSSEVSNEIIHRIDKLTPETKALWGKMTVSQMLAHCNVTYEMAFENIHPKPNAVMRFVLKLLVKNLVVNDSPYKKGSATSPAFIIKETKDFEYEKNRLKNYLQKTVEVGSDFFDGKESLSFGVLSVEQWNNMFYKHLDHHLTQFGV